MLCVHAMAQRQTSLTQHAGHSAAYLGMRVEQACRIAACGMSTASSREWTPAGGEMNLLQSQAVLLW